MKRNKLILLGLLIVWGILSRTTFHIGPNIEFVTAISIVAGFLFSQSRFIYIIPLLIMIPSDLIIGNTNIFIFTWTGFLFPVLIGKIMSDHQKIFGQSLLRLGIASTILGIFSTFFFYIWTNLGHFLTTNMYQRTFEGLIQCYINAIPFLKAQLSGNLVIVPLFVLTSVLALKLAKTDYIHTNTQKNS